MKQEITDDFGTYTVNTKNKPDELTNAEVIYLNIFDNGEKKNAARYKLSLSVVTDTGEYVDWNCSILNKFEPNLFFRNVPEDFKDAPFYRQFHKLINDSKNSGAKFDKKPSAGFFKLPRRRGMKAEQRPIILNAIAFMQMEENCNPFVALRFQDFTWSGEVEPTGNSRGPKFAVCLKSNTGSNQVSDEELDVNDYF
jgi:hypothetical protein